MSSRSGGVGRGLPDVLFVIVLSLGFVVPLLHHAAASGGGTSSGGTSGGGTSGGGTSGDGTSGTSGSSGDGNGADGGSGDPTGGGTAGPAPTSTPTRTGRPPATPTPKPTRGTTKPTPAPSTGSNANRPETVGDVFVATVEDLPIWLPFYCLIGLFGDPSDAPSNYTGIPRDVARACSNISFGGSGGSGSSTQETKTIDRSTPLKIEVLAPGPGETKPRIRVTPMPDDATDNDLLKTLLVVALVVIVVLVIALGLALRRRRRVTTAGRRATRSSRSPASGRCSRRPGTPSSRRSWSAPCWCTTSGSGPTSRSSPCSPGSSP